MKKLYLLNGFLLLFAGQQMAFAQADYSSNDRLSQRITALSKTYPALVKSRSLTKTISGKEVWMMTIGTGKVEQKPAIALVGGVEGTHLLGMELAIGIAEQLLAASGTDSVKNLLNKQTFYVFPNMSPDATEQYFSKVKYGRSGNARVIDSDRDGKTGEDGFDDLNGDGKISWMRIADPTGTFRLNPEDPRSLIPADAAKGETGHYLLVQEGLDNDKDGAFNEDGAEGVHFNRNSSYNYKNFIPGAGEFAVSELENRALFDFLYDAFNVYAVVTFGPQNNLSWPVQVNPAGLSKRIINSWSESDAKVNTLVSEKYNKIIGAKDAPKTTAESGDFSQWAYFHYGRLSFSTPGWWLPKVKPDSATKQKAFTIEDPTAEYLRWAKSKGITNTFTEWKVLNHPDFPGQTVEVGGLDPFVLSNPPYQLVEGIVRKHTDFVLSLAAMAPQIDLISLKTEKVEGGLSRISVKVVNTGVLPTLTKIGEKSYFLKKIAVKITTGTGQAVLSGRKSQLLEAIQGKGFTELSWLIKGSGKISIEAGSPSSGRKMIDVSL